MFTPIEAFKNALPSRAPTPSRGFGSKCAFAKPKAFNHDFRAATMIRRCEYRNRRVESAGIPVVESTLPRESVALASWSSVR